jgi:hypothetical protein
MTLTLKSVIASIALVNVYEVFHCIALEVSRAFPIALIKI